MKEELQSFKMPRLRSARTLPGQYRRILLLELQNNCEKTIITALAEPTYNFSLGQHLSLCNFLDGRNIVCSYLLAEISSLCSAIIGNSDIWIINSSGP